MSEIYPRLQRALTPGMAVAGIAGLIAMLLGLESTEPLARFGKALTSDNTSHDVQIALGRAALLALVNLIAFVGMGLLMDGRWTRNWRLHGLLVLCAIHAAFSPLLADLVSGPAIVLMPWPLQTVAVALGTGLAQAGLWAETFLVTGMLIDALHRRRPTYYAAQRHWRGGLVKGFMYGLLFMLLVQAYGFMTHSSGLLTLISVYPVLMSALAGPLLFCLGRTIIESFDESPPFLARLLGNMRRPMNHVRGILFGAGLAKLMLFGMQQAASGNRFAYGFFLGALIYAGADLIRDGYAILNNRRQRLQSWRIYSLGTVLGGLVGGVIAWYFDAAQIAIVMQRLDAYATLFFPAAGKATASYIIYPLFSRWGEMDLGLVQGGARLLYNDSLSGVINWAIAAPLFSINLVVLTALFERSLRPLRHLLSMEGLTGVVEQTVRVLRWGLWMAPIIQTFLRMAPEPSWYNQDGAIRTGVATVASLAMSAEHFRQWSLDVFLGLLAYEWLRVLIWFDHMGLRVASLVNLSFVGGDRFDEWAARFVGHRARTRSLPEGLRRFATWAPLLIPFYIPRGRDWDYVWGGAEQLGDSGGEILPAVSLLLVGYAVAALLAIVVGIVMARFMAKRTASVPLGAGQKAPPAFTLANGIYALQCFQDGRSASRVFSGVRKGEELDITRRPLDSLDVKGKFFYLREINESAPAEPLWSVGHQPVGLLGPDYALERPSRNAACWINSNGDIRAEAHVEIASDVPVEQWRIRLHNKGDKKRVLLLTTYQEMALNVPDGYERHPDYNAIHVGTYFVRPLGAVLARNRLLHNGQATLALRRPSREVAFHAVNVDAALGQITLCGYEDNRTHFIGTGTLRTPDLLNDGQHRAVDDEGLLYTFDPAASLQLRIEIPPGGRVEIPFIDGYACDEYEAAKLISNYSGKSSKVPLNTEQLDAIFARRRQLIPPHAPHKSKTLPFSFSTDGKELRLECNTPRPMAHVLANPLGHGAIVSNEGALFSFAGNAQQNGLSPFCLDSVPTQTPSQMIFVKDLNTGEIDTPCFAPYRRKDAQHHAIYGLGYVEFHKITTERELRLDIFLPPDKPVEVRILTIRNTTDSTARFSIASYVELALAQLVRDSLPGIETAKNTATGALYFRNGRNDFHQGWAFVASSMKTALTETVRTRFVGGVGHDLNSPYMLTHGAPDVSQADDGRRVAVHLGETDIPPQSEASIVMLVGQTPTQTEADALIRHYLDLTSAREALSKTKHWWREQLSVIRVETNRPDVDRMINDWLPYQLLTARLWGRAGPNQRSGAYGYRDQLQDVLPLIFSQPDLARQQILMNAAQQFREGDVLKWWHQASQGGTGIGQRTSAGDPHLWLPYVVIRYIAGTGDKSLLHEKRAFLEGEMLPRGTQQLLLAPRPSRDWGTVYEHCKRAIELSLSNKGARGLPLIGAGDWNDGFDLAGIAGSGESVWLGFFLHDVLLGFADLAAQIEGATAQARYLAQADELRHALDAMWREDRYVRLITDKGEEMTTLDALSAAWPTLCGVAGLERGRVAIETALKKLELDDLIRLLDRPFDKDSSPYPGRIAEYPPGVRENGGQYSHGTSWLVDALTNLSRLATAQGDLTLSQHFQTRAAEIWLKISPLDTCTPDLWPVYGLAPHQQAADVYFGEGYEGHGGWSWYTGAAARMISAAYALLGISLHNGQVQLDKVSPDVDSPIQLRHVTYRGKELKPGN